MKQQILTGPRPPGKLVYSMEDGEAIANEILPRGYNTYAKHEKQPRTSMYVHEAIEADGHWRLVMTIDRKTCRPVLKIRDTGKLIPQRHSSSNELPQKNYLFNVTDDDQTITDMAHRIGRDFEFVGTTKYSFTQVVLGLYKIFKDSQAISIEVDMLRHGEGKFKARLVCANSRFVFDDAAPNRAKKHYRSSREKNLEDEWERFAEIHGLVYVKMSGDIGTVVNGAGLAMATNDAISSYGGRSANFLDTGGQATKETIVKAFHLVMADNRVKCILVNIYGGKWEIDCSFGRQTNQYIGITRCDMIADAIVAAADELGPLKYPMVVRLQGTNAEAGLETVSISRV